MKGTASGVSSEVLIGTVLRIGLELLYTITGFMEGGDIMTKKAKGKGVIGSAMSYVRDDVPAGKGQQDGPNLGPHGDELPSKQAAARTDVPKKEEKNPPASS